MQKIFCYLLPILLISCHATKTTSVMSPATTVTKDISKELSGTWELQKLWASDNKWTRKPVITLDYNNKTFTGNNGCNSISGKFKSSGSFIAFDKNILSTKMACPGYSEAPFTNALLKANKFDFTDGALELSQDDIVLLSFKKQ